MKKWRRRFGAVLVGLTLAQGATARAAHIVFDYTYDTAGFFDTGSVNGVAARATLQYAGTLMEGWLNNTLSPIETPATFNSQFFDGQATFNWNATFNNPATGVTTSLDNLAITTNEYRIYVGGRSLAGGEAGRGGPGGFGYDINPTGSFTAGEIDQLNALADTFISQVTTRVQPAGVFASWGGSITFDNDGSTTWDYDHTLAPSAGQTDLLSVILHEIGHAVGLGSSSEWDALVAHDGGGNPFFVGAHAESAYGGPVPLLAPGEDHWDEGTLSTIFGTATVQEAAMDPTILNGTRKLFTTLDVAGLQDVGWQVPEPATLVFLLLGGAYLTASRRRSVPVAH